MSVQDRFTPTLAVLDPRGLAVRSVAFCRSDSSPVAEVRINRIEFDAVGRAVAQWDPRLWALRAQDLLTPSNLENVFSLSGVLLNSRSVDAGVRINLLGVVGQVLHSWDGRGSQQQIEYDDLLHPTAVFEQASNGAESCIARYLYGVVNEACRVRNQYGQAVRLDGPAGTCHFSNFGITGALLAQQQLFVQALEPPHWPQALSDRDGLLEPGEGATMRMVFNALDEVVMQTDAQGNRQQFDHNVDGQLRQTHLYLKDAEPQVLVSDIHYNAQGEIERETAGNGVVSTFDYAPHNGRLMRLYASLPQQQTLQDLNYLYDPVGNILSIENKALPVRHFANQRIEPISHYTYDSLYQLVDATGWEAGSANRGPDQIADPQAAASYHQTYRYDAGGNLLQLVHQGPQSNGRLLTAAQYSNRCLPEHNGHAPTQAETAAGFDACGNLRALENTRALGWNLRNQLSEVRPVQRETGLDDSEHYIYDVDGLRLRKIRSAQTNVRSVIHETRYLPGLEVRINKASGETLYVISAQAGRNAVQVLDWKGSTPKGLVNQQYRYTLGDHLGSCSLELDSQARVVSRETYHPFGTTAFSEKGNSSESSYRTLCYSGKERDATGLYYYGLRYYIPWLQRWCNPDPAGNIDGLNVYQFVRNNPMVFQDLKGLKAQKQTSRNNQHTTIKRQGLPGLLQRAAEFFSNVFRRGSTNLINQELKDLIGGCAFEKLKKHAKKDFPTAKKDLLSAGFFNEIRLLRSAEAHINSLVVPEGFAQGGVIPDVTQATDKAARWIAGQSKSIKDKVASEVENNNLRLTGILNKYVQGDADIFSFSTLRSLHRELVPDAPDGRGFDVSGASMPSSYGGESLMSVYLDALSISSSNHRAEMLMSGTIRYHPFADGNGRVARAAYSIATIKEGRFSELSGSDFDFLTGLPRLRPDSH